MLRKVGSRHSLSLHEERKDGTREGESGLHHDDRLFTAINRAARLYDSDIVRGTACDAYAGNAATLLSPETKQQAHESIWAGPRKRIGSGTRPDRSLEAKSDDHYSDRIMVRPEGSAMLKHAA